MLENTRNMENLYLTILLLIIFLMFVPIRVELRLTYNPFRNLGTFAPYLLGFSMGFSYFSFKGRGIYVVSKKSRKELVLAYTGPEVRFYNILNAQIANKFYLRTVELYANVGVGDAMKSAMLCSLIQSAACSVFGMIKNYKNESRVVVECNTAFNENIFQLAFLTRFSISIFDVVYSILMSVILNYRMEKKR